MIWLVRLASIDDEWPLHLYVGQNYIVWPPALILLVSSLAITLFYIFYFWCPCRIHICIVRNNYIPQHACILIDAHTQLFAWISILTWLPSRCQKTVGWGFPLVSHGKVAVRPWATIWSRGRTTNWGASAVKGKINNNTITTLWHRVLGVY